MNGNYSPEIDSWIENTADVLRVDWGIEKVFSGMVAEMLLYFFVNGLSPVITSGFRDPQKQKEMRDRWDRGDRAGMVARPAANSKHSNKSFWRPAALAVDIQTNDQEFAADIAQHLGITAGYYFKARDGVHFQSKNT